MFDHSADKISSIRLNSNGTIGKHGESAEEIYATLWDVDIYCEDSKKTKYVGQCIDSGRVIVTEGAAAGLSAGRRQDGAVYYMATYVLHAASKSLQNTTEKTFGESGLGEETTHQFIHTFWSSQETLGENFEGEWKYKNPGVPAGRVLDLDSEVHIGALPAYLTGVEANKISLKLQNPLLTIWRNINVHAMQIMASYKARVKLLENLHDIWS